MTEPAGEDFSLLSDEERADLERVRLAIAEGEHEAWKAAYRKGWREKDQPWTRPAPESPPLPLALIAHFAYLDRLIAGIKELDVNVPGAGTKSEPAPRGKPRGSDDRLAEWRAADRKAWAEYRKLEDQRFPYDPAKPWKDPPGMITARRAFEKEREISKAKEILRLREASRVV